MEKEYLQARSILVMASNEERHSKWSRLSKKKKWCVIKDTKWCPVSPQISVLYKRKSFLAHATEPICRLQNAPYTGMDTYPFNRNVTYFTIDVSLGFCASQNIVTKNLFISPLNIQKMQLARH